jgi:hypothetical protein
MFLFYDINISTHTYKETQKKREKATVCLARPTNKEEKKDDNNSKKKRERERERERRSCTHTHTHTHIKKWHSRRSERKMVVEQ